MTFGARYIANIIHFAGQQGANKKELLNLVGMSLEELNDENLRFDAKIYNTVIEKALVMTRDYHLGLHIGEYLSLTAVGLIANIVHASRTVKEALDHVVTFANLGCQALPFSLIEAKDYWILSIMPSQLWIEQSPQAVQHTIDAVLVFTLREFHNLTREKHRPTAIHFTQHRPDKFMEYERILNCPIKFNQTQNAILLDKKVVAKKIVTSDYFLLQVLVQHAQMRLAAMDAAQGFFYTVKQTIINLVKPQFPTLEQVAANLNVSIRTLQRKLKSEGYTYKSVLDELKKQFALDYIKNPNLELKEIAYLLDYADVSAFSRSFKRWTGKSPKKFRVVEVLS